MDVINTFTVNLSELFSGPTGYKRWTSLRTSRAESEALIETAVRIGVGEKGIVRYRYKMNLSIES